MLKFTAYLALFTLISFQAHAKNHAQAYYKSGHKNQDSPQYNQQRQSQYDQSSPHRRDPSQWNKIIERYFKASMGMSALKENIDSSGEMVFENTSVLPINLAYGFTMGTAMFEVELGFSNNDFEFISSGSPSDDFYGNIFSKKIMINGMYKTSMTGSNFYIGGGLGSVSVSLDGPIDELGGSSLGLQFILGGELRTSESSGFFVEFKNLRTIGLEVENDFAEIDFSFQESSLNMGFKIYF